MSDQQFHTPPALKVFMIAVCVVVVVMLVAHNVFRWSLNEPPPAAPATMAAATPGCR